MKNTKLLKRSLIPICLFIFCAAQAQNDYESGKLRLKFTEEMANEIESLRSQKTLKGNNLSSVQLNKLESQFNTTGYRRIFPDNRKLNAKHKKYGLHLWYEVEVDPSMDLSLIHI